MMEGEWGPFVKGKNWKRHKVVGWVRGIKAKQWKKIPHVRVKSPWVSYISKQKDEDTWMVKTSIDKHNCDQTISIASATAFVLSKEITDIIKNNPTIPIDSLQRQMEQDFEIGLSRQEAFTKQYNRLRDYVMELQRTNPGTIVKLDFERNTPLESLTRQFRRIYVCIRDLKRGFKEGKSGLLGLDGAFMKGLYPGQLLTAVGIDGNNGIYPLAYAIVEVEKYKSWTWFLENLGDDLSLLSKGLILTVSTLFPAVENRYCVRHIHENMKANGWKGEAFLRLVWRCVTATIAQEFRVYMNELWEYSLPAYTYLADIPPHHWVGAIPMLSSTCVSKTEAAKYKVLFNGEAGYQVSGPWQDQQLVDMRALTCTCRPWKLTGIPCKHVVETIWNMRQNNVQVSVPEHYVHEVYRLSTWKAMYSTKINGLHGPKQWPVSDVPIKITHPVHHKQAGIPKKIRMKSLGEDESGS